MSGTQWRAAFKRRAQRHWTPERLSALSGDKRLLLRPDEAPCLLRAMGVLDAQARLQPARVRKYRQINHMLSFLRPALLQLKAPELSLIDAGCGRSALGFLVAWWLERQGVQVKILGLDRGREVIAGCQQRAAMAGLDGMAFVQAELVGVDLSALWREAFDEGLALDGLLALHACDTATDHALALAARHHARFFAVAPCCQAELARQWSALEDGPLGLLQHNPHLRRTTAATVSDAMRAELMAEAGYDVHAVEFVEAHHTPKNTLIYGHRGGAQASGGYATLKAATGGCGITLAPLLEACGAL